ncbi:inhibitor of KinA sporulation pathway (predicted exonuclease) [Ureibacillus xyleni]|uniref:Inhibitor of KinA sporulation pathway (Predicted exonuclease) n=1 Tax=Ureibacillus xyleni TaxID=614648 RepID=A0A285TDA5_9BACL|nr:3'-5' exonuclease [Ureibacillus xyleni]SOC19635.1 inhibitor of KinA sporulation pathway (predicted exonuclease) [Ureibacillus xyleni]
MVRKHSFIFIDVEATLIRGKQYIIEIGAVKWMPNGEQQFFSQLIQPYKFKKLNSHIQKLTGITTEQLLCAKPFHAVIKDFMKWCSGDTILVTFGEFDRKVLEEELKRNHLDTSFLYPIIDFQQKYMIEHQIKEQPSLAGLMEKLQIEMETQHRALADAVSLFHIFKATNGETIIENQKTDEFGIVFSEFQQLEDTFDLNISYVSGKVSSSTIQVDQIKILTKQLGFDVFEEEKTDEQGEVQVIQKIIINPNEEVKLFLNSVIGDIKNKVLITRSGLKQLSKINRLHHCYFPKTEVMTMQHLLKNKDDLNEFTFKNLSTQSIERKLFQLIKKHEKRIIREYEKRNLFTKEKVNIS